jgi:mono/diheme cytochrome c family protein
MGLMQRSAFAMLAGAVLSAACGQPSANRPDIGLGEMPAEQRRELFDRLCASCHGMDGRGDGPVADQLTIRPANLTTLAQRHAGTFPRAHIVDVLSGQRRVRAHGTNEMPVWGQRLAPAESPAAAAGQLEQARLITALTDYVESLQR